MIELLELCGYEGDEVQTELPRVKMAFEKAGITAADIENGKRRLRLFYDLELRGVRRILGLCVKEFVDSMLVQEEGRKKLVYGFMAPEFETIGGAFKSVSRDIYPVHHFWAYMMVAGDIFDKMVPVFEEAEKSWLKSGIVAHCGNVKTLLGIFSLGVFPKPDLLITTGALCETAPKTFDLIHEVYDIPVHFYETCQDRASDSYRDASRRAVELEAKSIRKLVERVQAVTGVEITDAILLDTIKARSELARALRKMRKILINSDPLPLSPTHENIWMILNFLTLDAEGIKVAVDAIETMCVDLQARVDKGIGVVAKGSPRIISICPGHHIDPRLEKLITDTGIAMVGTDGMVVAPMPEHDSSDPYQKMALPLQISLFTCTAQKIPLLMELCRELKLDGVFNRYHSGCRTGDAVLIQEALEKKLGIPALLLEWENYDPRYYNHEQYRKKLEVFRNMMVNRSKPAGK